MKIETKEIFLVWGAIIVILSILTKLIYGLYMRTVFEYLSNWLGSSLTMALFWAGWVLALIKAIDVVMNWCIFNDDL
jgi:hypothetical protein